VDALLRDIHEEAALGYLCAGRSYLEGGHYVAACGALEQSRSSGGDEAILGPLHAFASGMAAYLARDHAECISQLERWSGYELGPPLELARLARSAIAGSVPLALAEGASEVASAASALLARIGVDNDAPATTP